MRYIRIVDLPDTYPLYGYQSKDRNDEGRSGEEARTLEEGRCRNIGRQAVKGFFPKRRLVAGTLTDVTLNRPGSVNSPAPFLCNAPKMVFSRWSSTAFTDLASSSACSAR